MQRHFGEIKEKGKSYRWNITIYKHSLADLATLNIPQPLPLPLENMPSRTFHGRCNHAISSRSSLFFIITATVTQRFQTALQCVPSGLNIVHASQHISPPSTFSPEQWE